MSNNSFSSYYFLEDVKIGIKEKYGNQERYAKKIGYSRKTLNKILNSGDSLTVFDINLFCNDIGLNLRDYLPRG